MDKIKVLSLFSGIGAFEKALTNLNIDFELVGFSEIDKYAIESYCAIHNVSKDINLGDVSKLETESIRDFDLMTYGFPCTDISVAGKQQGLSEGSGTRSSLLWEAMKIAKIKKPKYMIAENVKNLVGKKFKDDFGKWLKELNELGYNTYHNVLNAKDFGTPQNRERVFVVSVRKDVDNGNFEFPIGKDYGIRLKDVLEDTVVDKYYLSEEVQKRFKFNEKYYKQPKQILEYDNEIDLIGNLDIKGMDCIKRVYDPNGISPTLTTMEGGNRQPKVLENELKFAGGIGDKDWVGDNKELSRNYPQGNRVYDSEGVACSQTANGGGLGGKTGLYLETVSDKPMLVGGIGEENFGKQFRQGNRVYDAEAIAMCLNASPVGNAGGNSYLYKVDEINQEDSTLLIKNATKKGYLEAYDGDGIDLAYPDSETRRGRVQPQRSHTLTTSDNLGVLEGYRIRKLIPLECWRLMGFTDEDFNKAKITLNESFYKGKDKSDSQLYKQAGNSIVVNVLEALLHNLLI